MINSNRFRQSCLIVLFSSILMIFASCQQDLLDPPSFDSRQQSYTGSISAPTNVSATQGGFREIVLTWTASQNARQYCIYRSDSSAGTFEKFAETSDETPSFTDKAEAGILRYYKVSAVDSRGNESSLSNLTFGSTLATPIITKITKDTSGTAVTVHWYGGSNCTEKTYLSQLCFEVLLYDTDGTTILRETVVSGTENSVTFSSLQANRQYYFVVKAYIKSAQDDGHIESSDMVNESTAHRLIPDAPEELSITKGVSQTGVVLSWKLPASVDVKSGLDYIPHPVYFKVFRKELSASDDAYEIISSYIGVVRGNESYENSGTLSAGEYRIDCANGTAVKAVSKKDEKDPYSEESILGTLITLTKPSDGDSAANAYYPEYITGTTITFTDTTADIGKQYSYRVQSYTDDNGTKLVTSDESYADESGWKITTPHLRTSAEYVYAKDESGNDKKDEYASVNVSFVPEFEDFGILYKYVLVETKTTMKMSIDSISPDKIVETEESVLATYDSIDDIKPITYTTKDGEYYYYKYKLKVCSAGQDYIDVDAPGTILVIRVTDRQPKINEFTVEDGYREYFKLSWDYNKDYSYTLQWTENSGTETQKLVLEEKDLDLTTKTGYAYYTHDAESGDTRTYTLVASNGMIETKSAELAKTLGTPELIFSEIDYDKITVEWNPVQSEAGGYKIEAKYEDGTGEVGVGTINQTENSITYTIDKPAGYDNALQSGKTILFKVTTQSFADGATLSDKEKADKTAEKEIKVCTLGPALTKTGITNSDYDKIIVKWKEVEGAAGYKIYRTKYELDKKTEDGKEIIVGWKPSWVDVYYQDAAVLKPIEVVEGSGSEDVGDDTKCKFDDGAFILTDAYADSYDDNEHYSVNQSQIAWGIPFSYVVIPVKAKDDAAGTFDENSGALGIQVKDFSYTGIDIADTEKNATGATIGYGLNLTATKAESTTEVTLKWDAPYKNTDPVIYCRGYGDNNKGWEKIKLAETNPVTLTTVGEKPDIKDSDNPFDYLVVYNKNSQTVGIHNSFEKELDANIVNTERTCKGYTFPLPGILQAGKNAEKYSEYVTCTLYDYSKRAVGPDYYEIFMLNENRTDGKDKDDKPTQTAGWVSICKLQEDAKTIFDAAVNYDITVASENTRIIVKPAGIASGTATTTDGLLKVLRDYKHYYKIEAVRDTVNNGTIRTSYGDDKSVYAYREITDEELVRAATLAMAIGFKHARDNRYGVNDNDKWSAANGEGSYEESGLGNGTVTYCSYKDRSSILGIPSGDVYHKIAYKKYKPEMETKSGKKVSFLTIDAQDGNELYGETWSGTAISAPTEYHSRGKDMNVQRYITVTGPSETGGLYSAQLAFFWLGPDKEPRYTDNEGYKGIKISYPAGNSEKVFGNITPLPFNVDGSGSAGFKQDNDDWQ